MGLLGWLRVLISIHALLAESDVRYRHISFRRFNFYPRSPCGERLQAQQVLSLPAPFLSTLSLRRATPDGYKHINSRTFLSTLSLRRATFHLFASSGVDFAISIHALLAESDVFGLAWLASCSYFYPRSPCGERRALRQLQSALCHFYPRSPCGERLTSEYDKMQGNPFLSTLSLRRATNQPGKSNKLTGNFYPRSPCGERRTSSGILAISLHFYPRSPCGERPVLAVTSEVSERISIHALLAESDCV